MCRTCALQSQLSARGLGLESHCDAASALRILRHSHLAMEAFVHLAPFVTLILVSSVAIDVASGCECFANYDNLSAICHQFVGVVRIVAGPEQRVFHHHVDAQGNEDHHQDDVHLNRTLTHVYEVTLIKRFNISIYDGAFQDGVDTLSHITTNPTFESCGKNYTIGKTYLVVGFFDGDEVHTSQCAFDVRGGEWSALKRGHRKMYEAHFAALECPELETNINHGGARFENEVDTCDDHDVYYFPLIGTIVVFFALAYCMFCASRIRQQIRDAKARRLTHTINEVIQMP